MLCFSCSVWFCKRHLLSFQYVFQQVHVASHRWQFHSSNIGRCRTKIVVCRDVHRPICLVICESLWRFTDILRCPGGRHWNRTIAKHWLYCTIFVTKTLYSPRRWFVTMHKVGQLVFFTRLWINKYKRKMHTLSYIMLCGSYRSSCSITQLPNNYYI